MHTVEYTHVDWEGLIEIDLLAILSENGNHDHEHGHTFICSALPLVTYFYYITHCNSTITVEVDLYNIGNSLL